MPDLTAKRWVALICFLLVLVTVGVYWPVAGYDFLVFDDRAYLAKNARVQSGLSAANVMWAFGTLEFSNWHPLTWLSYMLDCQLFGLNAKWSHLINLCFHAANSLLLFWFWNRATAALWPSALVAALFAWHPLHVESVAWVAERKDVLSTFFGLMALLAYVKWAGGAVVSNQSSVIRTQSAVISRRALTSKYYWLAVGFFALGLMAKPMLVTMPFVLLLLDFWPLRRFQLPGGGGGSTAPVVSIGRLIGEKAPFFLLAGFSSVMTFIAQKQGGAMLGTTSLPLESRVGNAILSYGNYIGKMFWPVHLAAPYPFPKQLPTWPIVGAGLMLAIISFTVLWQARRRPYLLTGWLWYLGTLVPVIGLVQVGLQSMADRYTYVPLIGLFVMVSWGLNELTAWRYRPASTSLAVATLVGCVIATRLQIPFWQNSGTLFEHTLKVTSDNSIAEHNLGGFYLEQGKVDPGIKHLARALDIGPELAGTHHDLGLALMSKGRLPEAIEHFRAAVRIDPGVAEFQKGLGRALMGQGKYAEAETQFLSALRLRPNDAELHCDLAEALSHEGNLGETVNHYREALRVNPKSLVALNNLAWLFATCPDAKFRDGAEAVRLAEQACELTLRKETVFVGTLAAAYAEAGQFPKAIETADKAHAMAVAAGDSELAGINQKLVELFRSGRAYREEVQPK